MTDEHPTANPPRMLQHSPTMATLFTDAESEYRLDIDEARAWERLQSRLSARDLPALPLKPQPWLWLTSAVAAGFLLGWFGWRAVHPASGPLVAAGATVTVPSSRDSEDVSLRLAAGKSKLPDGTEVELGDGAQGTFHGEKARSTLEFDNGRLDIAVARQPAARPFVVKARNYEFVVLGTRFSVKVAGPRVDLDVTEGRVAVTNDDQQLKVVEVGGHWSNLDEAPSAQAPSAQAPSATVPSTEAPTSNVSRSTPAEISTKAAALPNDVTAPSDPSICRDLARTGKPKQAEQCYVSVASGNGLSAEMALYEVARLRRDVLGNPTGSLAALDDYEKRFASGTLAPEVRMARVDLLARLGRVEQALEASGQLLGSASGRARTVELRLLRGNLLRDKLHDCGAANAEYRQIESDPGPRGDQAQYAHAQCLEQLGRAAEAIQIYRSYLARPKPQQAERARARLQELTP
jgi:hypothetical protein